MTRDQGAAAVPVPVCGSLRHHSVGLWQLEPDSSWTQVGPAASEGFHGGAQRRLPSDLLNTRQLPERTATAGHSFESRPVLGAGSEQLQILSSRSWPLPECTYIRDLVA